MQQQHACLLQQHHACLLQQQQSQEQELWRQQEQWPHQVYHARGFAARAPYLRSRHELLLAPKLLLLRLLLLHQAGMVLLQQAGVLLLHQAGMVLLDQAGAATTTSPRGRSCP